MAGGRGYSVKIGGGIIKAVGTVSIDVASVATQTDVLATFTLIGCKVGDMILVFAFSSWDGRLSIIGASVLTDGVVTVRFRNTSGVTVDAPASPFRWMLIDV